MSACLANVTENGKNGMQQTRDDEGTVSGAGTYQCGPGL
jgi:hypothetical protein